MSAYLTLYLFIHLSTCSPICIPSICRQLHQCSQSDIQIAEQTCNRANGIPFSTLQELLNCCYRLAVKKSGAGVVEEESSTVLTDMASYAKLVKYVRNATFYMT